MLSESLYIDNSRKKKVKKMYTQNYHASFGSKKSDKGNQIFQPNRRGPYGTGLIISHFEEQAIYVFNEKSTEFWVFC